MQPRRRVLTPPDTPSSEQAQGLEAPEPPAELPGTMMVMGVPAGLGGAGLGLGLGAGVAGAGLGEEGTGSSLAGVLGSQSTQPAPGKGVLGEAVGHVRPPMVMQYQRWSPP